MDDVVSFAIFAIFSRVSRHEVLGFLMFALLFQVVRPSVAARYCSDFSRSVAGATSVADESSAATGAGELPEHRPQSGRNKGSCTRITNNTHRRFS